MKRTLRFVHAADLHLGHPFARLPYPVAARLRRDEASQMKRLVDLCLDADADLLVLAGDVFDSHAPRRETVACLHDGLETLADRGVPCVIAPGNHDPLWPDSPYRTVRWPDTTVILSPSRQTATLRTRGAVVYGTGLTARHAPKSCFVSFMPPLDAGMINILCLHGDLVGPGESSLYNPVTRDVITAVGLDYVALGHIHGRPQDDPDWPWPHVAYAGSWRGLGFDEPGRHGVDVVTIEKTAPAVELSGARRPPVTSTFTRTFVPLDRHPFLTVTLRRSGEAFSPDTLVGAVRAAAESIALDGRDVLIRLTLQGDYGAYRPSIGRLTAALEREAMHIELIDRSYPPFHVGDETGHSLRAAFVRQAQAAGDDEIKRLAYTLGMAAFYDDIDLERWSAQ